MRNVLCLITVFLVSISLTGCFEATGNKMYSAAGNLVAKLPMAPKSRELVQAKADLADVRSKIAKTEKDLGDADALRIESHNGIMEALGHKSGPSMAKDMVEPTPSPYVAEQVEMHRKNQDIAIREKSRCQSDLQNLRGREKSLTQKVEKLENEVPLPAAPAPDGGGGSGGSGC